MRKTRHKKRNYTRIKYFGLFVVLVLAIVGAIKFIPAENDSDDRADIKSKIEDKGVVHILLMGVDRRADDVGRSDTLMVATVDMKNNKAALLSVPRDTLAPIEGHKYDKINHAYAYGGQKLTQKTAENLLGVSIDRYVMIDTGAFEKIIDAMGGIDINVEKRMYYEDPWDDNGGLVIDLYPGEQHLDGYGAVQYVRYRDGEGDIGRISRQQKFMKALLSQVVTPAMLSRLPNIIEKVGSAVETDMSAAEILEFSRIMKNLHDNGLAAKTLPGTPAYFDDVSYWLPDMVALRTELAKDAGASEITEAAAAAKKYTDNLPNDLKKVEESANDIQKDMAAKKDSEKTEEKSEEKTDDDDAPAVPENISVMVINSSGINGAGADAADILRRKGFIISGVETGKTDSKENTSITTAAQNTDLFYGMPFECIILDGGDKNQAVVNIGRDYVKQNRE